MVIFRQPAVWRPGNQTNQWVCEEALSRSGWSPPIYTDFHPSWNWSDQSQPFILNGATLIRRVTEEHGWSIFINNPDVCHWCGEVCWIRYRDSIKWNGQYTFWKRKNKQLLHTGICPVFSATSDVLCCWLVVDLFCLMNLGNQKWAESFQNHSHWTGVVTPGSKTRATDSDQLQSPRTRHTNL